MEKKKFKLVRLIIVAIVLVVIIVAAVIIVKNKGKVDNGGENEIESNVIDLPNTVYSEMEVGNIEMEYLTNNNETMVSMTITNTTERAVSEEMLTAVLLNDNNDVLGSTKTYIQSLPAGEQYNISVILKGDLTSTTKIKLEKISKEEKTQE